jgi:hypothetical protein
MLAGRSFAFFPAVAQGRQNAVLNCQKVGLSPLCPPQHQQEIIDVPEWPVRFQGLRNARRDSSGYLIGLR